MARLSGTPINNKTHNNCQNTAENIKSMMRSNAQLLKLQNYLEESGRIVLYKLCDDSNLPPLI